MECDIFDCKKCFHVTCAVNNDLIFACDKLKALHQHKEHSEFIGVFCSDHLELGQSVMSSSESQSRQVSLKKRKSRNPFKLLTARLEASNVPVPSQPILKRP